MSGDYCFQCKQKEIKIKTLEKELVASVEKQHEAMGRALQLAERNQHLERELKDIDCMALEVEKECQNKMKQNFKNMDILQNTLKEKIDEIKKLEETLLTMKNKIQLYEQELTNLKTDKKFLEKNLSLATNEKKTLNDKINNFLLNEKNLNSKIFKLQETNKILQQQISSMEEKVMGILKISDQGELKGRQKKSNYTSSFPISKTPSMTYSELNSLKTSKEDKKDCSEIHCCHMSSTTSILEKIQKERDFYHDRLHCLEEQLEMIPVSSAWRANILMELKDKEKEICDLKQENIKLRRENVEVLGRCTFEEGEDNFSRGPIKILLDKLEKERDSALTDIVRLQGERDALKEKIKLVTETQMAEQLRLEKILNENEERIRRLESERRELISSQSCQRVALAKVEEQFDDCKEKTRTAHAELMHMTANYNQLKTLQEQTDRSLCEVQSRLAQVDMELRLAKNKIKELEKINADLETEISLLKKEKSNLKSNLAFVEKEKDGLLINLDEKTEKVAKLENQMRKQETHVIELNEKYSALEKKFEFTLDEKTSRELGLRTLEQTLERLREEMQACERQKEALVRENRRLQDDLAAAAKDCLSSRKELEDEKQEVVNLKKQLQQYFGEVKKAEELLTKKESERNQMLEHFRCLSIEATALESNNHTLESTVENAKTQLISANNRIVDLEHQMGAKDSLLSSYENQIAELTSKIAGMELKLKQELESKARTEEDLHALRNLCSTIDDQKETLRKKAESQDVEKFQLINEVRRLSEEYEGLSEKFTRERNLSLSLEKSLSSSQQETLEHRITNKDLQTQVQQLRQKVNELTEKLESESQEVKRYQSQCADLSQQVGDLRREVTNARFEQAKALEDSRRNFPQNFFNFDEEDEDGTFFEGKEISLSPRNVPPLTFREDSDRTTSLPSDEDFVRFPIDEGPTTLSKPLWRLSPLPEKLEDTASQLSSLPEDSETKNRFVKTDATYSVRKSLDSASRGCLDCGMLREGFGSGLGGSGPDDCLDSTEGNSEGCRLALDESKSKGYFSEYALPRSTPPSEVFIRNVPGCKSERNCDQESTRNVVSSEIDENTFDL